MAGQSRLTKAFGLTDADAWRRHANPWSVYTRIPVPPRLNSAEGGRYARFGDGPMDAPADEIWNIVADVRNTGRFSPEVIEAEWLDGATGPALGARFRGHVRRNEIGPVYWTTCRVTACEPGQEFGFEVLVGDRP